MKEYTEIKQIMPLPFQTMAVYGNEETGGIWRNMVVCLALLHHECEDSYEEIIPITWCNGDKDFDSDTSNILLDSNFLGLEFYGKVENWDKELEKLKSKKQNKDEKN